MKTEQELIEQIRARSLRTHPDLLLGIGDDAALIRNVAGRVWAITTDQLVEDVHFSMEYTDPRCLGRKSMAVNLSDLAAMGAEPEFALLSLAVPRNSDREVTDEVLRGIEERSREFGVVLIGGDLSATPDRWVINITALGKCDFGAAIRRDGAKAGDQVWVSGALGGAKAGLELLRHGERLDTASSEEVRGLILTQLDPTPRVALGRVLAEHRLASAMIDISDGLSTDLTHICEESGVGAVLELSSLPIAGLDPRSGFPTMDMALHGGEDYELLFTVAPDHVEALKSLVSGFPITRIGEITDRPGMILLEDNGERRPLLPLGFDHFK
ncbi:MAG: thiamine-phosphate kinase [Acidobacteria bacterium]|nr:thiamine-phosphate kinase [Acidobacteriota bacterium]